MTDIISGADIMVMEGAEEEMFAGDGPLLPSGMLMPGVNKTPDQRVYQQIKGPMIRGPELEAAALKFNMAPCLPPIAPTNIRVENLITPIKMEVLPFAGPTEAPLPEVGPPVVFIPGEMGLPEDLLAEMGEFQFMKPPSAAPSPVTGLPPLDPTEQMKTVPLDIEVINPYEEEALDRYSEEVEEPTGFNLEDFLE